jgi:hypothetical protein
MTRDTHKKASDLDSKARNAPRSNAPSDLSEQLQDFVIDEVIGMLKRDKIIIHLQDAETEIEVDSVYISERSGGTMTKIADVKAGVWTLKRDKDDVSIMKR